MESLSTLRPYFTARYTDAFILVLLRTGAIVVTLPVISESVVPVMVKAGLTLIIAVVIFPLVAAQIPPLDSRSLFGLVGLLAGEVLIGVTIGFVARMYFAAIQLAGDIIGFQMGFSVVNVIDPMSSAQVSVITQLQYMIAMLIFLTVDAHHLFFQALMQSYADIPVAGFQFSGGVMQLVFEASRDMFALALKIAAPIMAVMIFTNVALGVVARTVPQMNIFIVGFPLQISLGLIFLGLTAPLFVRLTEGLFGEMGKKMAALLRLM